MTLKSPCNLKGLVVVAAISLTFVGAASARTWAFGSGETKNAAVKNTNEAARLKAKELRTCYHPVEEAYCKNTDGKWTCISEVTSYRIDPGLQCRFDNGHPRQAFPSLSKIDPWVVAKMAGVTPKS
jgi:hypothetical protein